MPCTVMTCTAAPYVVMPCIGMAYIAMARSVAAANNLGVCLEEMAAPEADVAQAYARAVALGNADAMANKAFPAAGRYSYGPKYLWPYMVMAYIGMADIVMACVVMAYVVMAYTRWRTRRSCC